MLTSVQICKTIVILKEKKKECAPLNLFEGDIIKTLQHFCFHVTKGLCIPSNMEMKFCHTLILLYKVQFAVVPGIKTTQVVTGEGHKTQSVFNAKT